MRKDSPLRVFDNNATADRQLTRREAVRWLLAGAGAGMTLPLVAQAHPICAHLRDDAILDEVETLGAADWKPVFLNVQQDESLVLLAERIVPGSEKARVNRFIDLLLSVDKEKHQRDFIEALAAFEAESGKRFGKHLTALDGSQVEEILTDAAAQRAKMESSGGEDKESSVLHAHFENLKGWISGAYYSSEAGMRELGWTGDYAFASFPGCEHPEGHS
jgi:Gluconate 2-dehydrogenase subunit 3